MFSSSWSPFAMDNSGESSPSSMAVGGPTSFSRGRAFGSESPVLGGLTGGSLLGFGNPDEALVGRSSAGGATASLETLRSAVEVGPSRTAWAPTAAALGGSSCWGNNNNASRGEELRRAGPGEHVWSGAAAGFTPVVERRNAGGTVSTGNRGGGGFDYSPVSFSLPDMIVSPAGSGSTGASPRTPLSAGFPSPAGHAFFGASPVSPPLSPFLAQGQVRRRMGIVALNQCYQSLLDLQGERSRVAETLGVQSPCLPVLEPTDITPEQLLSLMEFAKYQYDLLLGIVTVLEKKYSNLDSAVLDEIWISLHGTVSISDYRKAPEPIPTHVSPANPFTRIMSLKSSMKAWEEFSQRFLQAANESRDVNMKSFLENMDTITILLNHYKELTANMSSDLWGLRSALTKPKTEVAGQFPCAKMPLLPYREDDRIQLPSVRFPPTRKQKCAPRYNNKK